MADLISNIITDKQDIKNQLGSIPDILPIVKRFSSNVGVKRLVTKQIVRTVAGAMIWGSPVFGVWGEAEWGNTSGSSFILNSAEFGVLGINKLGANGSAEALYSVVPNNNLFQEYFGQDMLIDAIASTGSLLPLEETYTLAPETVLQSEVIAKLRVPITSATILAHDDFKDEGAGTMILGTLGLGVSIFGDDTVQLELSNDSGLTWITANEGVTTTFLTSSVNDELKYRLTASIGTTVLTKPLQVRVNG